MSDKYNDDADFNRDRIQEELIHLSGSHWKVPLIDRDYGSFWRHVKEINGLFRELKPLRRSDRETLWAELSSICDETKQTQQEEREERECRSNDIKNSILSDIHSAEVQDLFGFDPPDVEEMKRLSNVLQDAREELTEKKYEMLPGDRQECYDALHEVQRSHDAWWEDLKRHRSEKHEQFQQRLRNNLERNRDSLARANRALEKSIEYRQRLEDNIEGNQEKLERAQEALERFEGIASDLEDKIAGAWNDSWRENAEERLENLNEKISDIEGSIERIEGWIENDNEKLAEVEEKISDIEGSIERIEGWIDEDEAKLD